MTELVMARAQMAMLFAFHILFAVAGMGMPVLMVIAERAHLRTGHPVYAELARRWAKGTSVLFAVGAVSGTVLSFELGLLWPRLMGTYGAAYGIPFAVEGLFFFIEAIFVAVYIYGWRRMRPWPHFWTGIPVVLSGVGGTLSVVAANAWMNRPAGFTLRDGTIVDVRPLDVIFNGAFWYESLHMLLAAYMVAG